MKIIIKIEKGKYRGGIYHVGKPTPIEGTKSKLYVKYSDCYKACEKVLKKLVNEESDVEEPSE